MEIRLDVIGEEVRHIVAEDDLLDVQLILDDLHEEVRQFMRRLDIHLPHRLAILDVRCVACRTAERYDLKHDLHIVLERGINPRLVGRREVREVHRDRRVLVHGADEIAVDALRDERHHRRRCLHRRHKCCIERQIGVYLILLHPLRPEAAAAAAHVPVRQLLDEGLQCLGRLCDAVMSKTVIHRAHHRVQTREHPAIHHRKLVIVQRVLGRIEFVDVRIEYVERVGVPQRSHEFARALLHSIVVEAVRQPRRAVLVEVPADRVRAVPSERIHRVNGVALGLAHLLPVFILHMTEHNDIPIGTLVKEQRADGDQ